MPPTLSPSPTTQRASRGAVALLLLLCAWLAQGCWLRPLDGWSPRVGADVPRDLSAEDAASDVVPGDVPNDLTDEDAARDILAEDVPGDLSAEDVPGDLPEVSLACASDAGRCEGPCAGSVCEQPIGATGNDNATCAWTRSGAVYCWGTDGYFAGPVDDVLRPTRVAALTEPVVEVALATYKEACAVTRAGALLCWRNDNDRRPQVAVATGVARVVAGGKHVCALLTSGHVTCRGDNALGQLGRGSRDVAAESAVFARVLTSDAAELTDAVDLAAGADHTCARLRDGTLWCWGSDEYAQLGSGARSAQRCGSQSVPCSRVARRVSGVSFAGALTAQSFALGQYHSCARGADGAVACWGRADVDGLAPMGMTWPPGTTAMCADAACLPSATPVPSVAGAQRVIAGRAYTCALRADPTRPVVCWGREFEGIEGIEGIPFAPSALAAGVRHGCVIGPGGAMSCWGHGDDGQIAHATALRPVAARVTGITGATGVAAGQRHTCALAAGAVRCWGTNEVQQLGDGTDADRGFPVAVRDLTDAREVAAGNGHTCARRGDQTLWCWGLGDHGQLGPGRAPVAEPDPVLADADGGVLSGVRAVALGEDFSCALRGGAVECWGLNESCQTGSGFDDGGLRCARDTDMLRAPVPLPIGAPEALAVTTHHVCVREGADGGVGAVACWGANGDGQANPADGGVSPASAPARVALPGAATDVSAGAARSCALVGGAALCWGDMGRALSSPRVVVSAGVAAVRSGGDFDCAVMAAGRAVHCWGRNAYGQLGDGTLVDRTAPAPVVRAEGAGAAPLDDVTELSLAQHHACALRGDGTVWCWGSDLRGQLGQGNTRRLRAALPIVY